MKYAARRFARRVVGMSYTLRGRLESRLASAVVPFLVACRARGGAAARGGRSSSRG